MHTKSRNRPLRKTHRFWPPPGPPPLRAAISAAAGVGNSPGWLRSDAGAVRRIAEGWRRPGTEAGARDPRRHVFGTAEEVSP